MTSPGRRTSCCILTVFFFVGLTCCKKSTPALFTKISGDQSGIKFQNTINENERINLLTNEYTYMGGGVGIGDFNNDGLVDIFFTASQSSCALYQNEGNLKFKDVTAAAGVRTNAWCTGVSVVDINGDGWLDIYVCVSGSLLPEQRRNLLYINNHDFTFTESAAAYGLADDSYSTQAVFLDYDKDGFLDMYLLTHQMYGESINRVVPKDLSGHSPRNDKLFRNQGIDASTGRPVFKEVTIEAGIKEDGYGLGVVVSDFNNDNWPDIYVSNDYIGNDCLWLNMQDGTFKNCIAQSINHQSYSSMGTDAADIDNDGMPDIVTLDMMPQNNGRKKMMYSIMTNVRHEMELKLHYEPSYMQNTLQLNRGVETVNDSLVPVFSDIANFAGIAETDWSWSVLAADFDYDGYKDLHITNGMGQDLLNHDFAVFSSSRSAGGPNQTLLTELEKYGSVPLANYLYMHSGRLSFENQSAIAGIDEKAISNGSAYADLDNDGDLDLIVNNINQDAFVFANNTLQQEKAKPDFIAYHLKGPANNTNGFGTKVKVYTRGQVQLFEQNPVRGFLSSVDNRIFIGLGKSGLPDSVQVIWPNDRMQVIRNLKPNTTNSVAYTDAQDELPSQPSASTFFQNDTRKAGIRFQHVDSFYFDYTFQQLLPQKFSYLGPGIAVADVDRNGLQDFYVGNGFMHKGMLFLQQQNGTFTTKELEAGDKVMEDTDCLFFDADGDGDEDLLITSGTNEFPKSSLYYLPRLYLNDGRGNFVRDLGAIPTGLTVATATVIAMDYDKDGDPDLFIGGRVSTQNYPSPAPSYVLENNHGKFTDVTEHVCPAFRQVGMVTDALWIDLDNDHLQELVISGEWMPIRIFKFGQGIFKEITGISGLADDTGLWRSLHAADLDQDGDIDIVAGNMGLNNRFHVTSSFPLNIWYADIDGNGSIDPVMAYYIPTEKGIRELYPAINLDDITAQVPSLKKRFLLHKDFSTTTMQALFEGVNNVTKLTANTLATCWFENNGKGNFTRHELPAEAQLAPVNCLMTADYNQDSVLDILLAGNEYQSSVMDGRYDASYGQLLLGNGNKKTFTAVSPGTSGFFLRGDVRCLRPLVVGGTSGILAAVNNGVLQLFTNTKKSD